eukprot:scaffold7814_cov296-Pinguiococcus_pyrenoidosus.AAC.3
MVYKHHAQKSGAGGAKSAIARRIEEQRRKEAEEEERVRRLKEEEEARLREEELKKEEEERKKEEERERRRKKKADRIERQKREGTYKTKKQKQQEAAARERLAAMQAAGYVVAGMDGDGDGDGEEKKSKPVYDNRRRRNRQKAQQEEEEEEENHGADEHEGEESKDLDAETNAAGANGVEASDKTEGGAPAAPVPAVDEAPEPAVEDAPEAPKGAENGDADEDDWEQDNGEDDWENDDWENDDPLDDDDEEEEDEVLRQARLEKERLRKLGEERERREEEKRRELEAQRLAMEHERELEEEAERVKEACRQRRRKAEGAARAARSPDRLRCPITVIMGHVDTGKTKLLDKIRQTNVQDGEAGGITQQIGATFFERSTLLDKTAKLNEGPHAQDFDLNIPGLLIIDTPGHEAFDNLRNRGSSLCDVAILVIDVMHGIEQTTRESLKMLQSKNVPYIIALNKVDRCFGWQSEADRPIQDALDAQETSTTQEVQRRIGEARLALNEIGLNVALYWEDDAFDDDVIPMCPTSAITGEGVPDLLRLLSKISQTRCIERIMAHDALECTVMEVKVIEGLGTTVDAILVNGELREGDKIVCCTLSGPVVTSIRAILTPPPSRELRVRAEYIHHASIRGAIGVKITGQHLENVIAGTPIKVVGPNDVEDVVVEEVMKDFKDVNSLATDKVGVLAQASTLGALEALLKFLRHECDPPIPVAMTGIGPIFQKDILRAGLMNTKGHPEFATILAFDVRIDAQAREKAEEESVRIFTADIIYHLFDQFQTYMSGIRNARKEAAMGLAVFPVICKIMPQHIFNNREPIIVGIEVVEGTLRVGTPLVIPMNEFLPVGRVMGIENNHRSVDRLAKGQTAAVRIENAACPQMAYGRQFDATHPLTSQISRESIDALKEFFKDEITKEDLRLLVKLKKIFGVKDAVKK